MSLATPLSAFTVMRLLVLAVACCNEEKPVPPAKPHAHTGLEDVQIAPAAGAVGQKPARQIQLFAEKVDQQQPWLHVYLADLAVDGHRNRSHKPPRHF